MMTINSAAGTNNNVQAGFGRNMQMDSASKSIQNQIANAQKQLQELSSKEDMTPEEKMKKRQEIQQEITNLNQQLRQRQMEQRKEQQAEAASAGSTAGSRRKAAEPGKRGRGMSQAGMQAMISADVSMKQAKVQGSTAVQMEGKAGVLEAEIKLDKGRGLSTEKKEEELADLQTRVSQAQAAQVSALADAGRVMEEAAEADRAAETDGNENGRTDKESHAEKTDGSADNGAESSVKSEAAAASPEVQVIGKAPEAEAVQAVPQTVYNYTPVDIRL